MASYLLNASSDAVVIEACSYLQRFGPVNRMEDQKTDKVTLSSNVPISSNLLAPEYTCSFEQAARGTLVTTSFRLPIYYRAGISFLLLLSLLLLACMILFLKPFIAHLVNAFRTTLLNLACIASGIRPKELISSQDSVFVLIALADVLLFPAWFFCFRKTGLALSRHETAFWKALKGCGAATLVAPADYKTHLRGVAVCAVLLLVFLLIILCWQWSIWLVLLGLLAVLLFSPPVVAILHFRNQPTMHWKPILLTFVLKWVSVNVSVVLALVLILVANVFILRGLEAAQHRTFERQPELRTLPTFAEIVESLERESSDRIVANKAILGACAKQATRAIIEAPAIPTKHANKIEEILTKYIAFGINLAVAVGLAMMAFFWWYLTKVPKEWRQLLASEQPIRILIPSLAQPKLESSLVSAGCLSVYIGGLLINWMSAIIGIDALAFIFTSKTLIIPQSETLFAWIPVAFLFSGESLKLCSTSTSWALSRLVVMTFAIPACLFCTSKLSCLIVSLVRRAAYCVRRTRAKTSVPHDLPKWVEDVCEKEGLPRPRLRIVPFQGIRVQIRVPPFIFPPAIDISPAAVRELSADELKVILGHEIGHLRQGARKLSFMRALSTFGLFPNSVLALIFNFVRRELEADLFALSITKNPGALISAITKAYASRLRLGVSQRTKVWKRAVQASRVPRFLHGPAVFFRFFFSPEILGYSHVHPVDRVKQIQTQVSSGPR